MVTGTNRLRTAFTLIELLVVVAIIALLISILLPALSRAKEQARIATCLANMRSISIAANQYLMDQQQDLPWALPSPYWAGGKRYLFRGYYTEFIWGGGYPQATSQDWNNMGEGGGTGADVYAIPPRYRPMNPYLSPEVSWDVGDFHWSAWRDSTPAIVRNLPGFFICPSDTSAWVPFAEGGQNEDLEGDTTFSTWYYWGTSYPSWWYWPYYYQRTQLGRQTPYNGDFLTILGGMPGRAKGLGSHLIRDRSARNSSEFIIYYENRMNYAMEGARPPMFPLQAPWRTGRRTQEGWHKAESYYTAAFLDGSARYARYDTRFIFGDGWSMWPNKPWEGDWDQYNDYAPNDQNAN